MFLMQKNLGEGGGILRNLENGIGSIGFEVC